MRIHVSGIFIVLILCCLHFVIAIFPQSPALYTPRLQSTQYRKQRRWTDARMHIIKRRITRTTARPSRVTCCIPYRRKLHAQATRSTKARAQPLARSTLSKRLDTAEHNRVSFLRFPHLTLSSVLTRKQLKKRLNTCSEGAPAQCAATESGSIAVTDNVRPHQGSTNQIVPVYVLELSPTSRVCLGDTQKYVHAKRVLRQISCPLGRTTHACGLDILSVLYKGCDRKDLF